MCSQHLSLIIKAKFAFIKCYMFRHLRFVIRHEDNKTKTVKCAELSIPAERYIYYNFICCTGNYNLFVPDGESYGSKRVAVYKSKSFLIIVGSYVE